MDEFIDWSKTFTSVFSDGTTRICVHDGNHSGYYLYHCADGPAMFLEGRICDWWWQDQFMSFDKWVQAASCPPELAVMLKLQYG